MKKLREDVLAALREAERVAATLPAGSAAHAQAADAVDRLQALHDDIETAIRLGLTDRGEFAALFEEAQFERGRAEVS